MYEIAAVCAALAFTVAWFAGARRGKSPKAFFTARLMFWGAALMWGVDCVAEVLDGEPAFDMSADAACLAALILACGLGVFAVLRFTEIRRGRLSAD